MTSQGADFTRLLDYLRATRGFDFSGYKLSSLVRRVKKRMGEVGVETYADYVDFLEVHPDEFQPLFNTVLINVTSFFRDEQAWQFVAENVIPRILEERGPERPIRVWSAGCATGEEAYTVAMLLAEAMGEQDFRERAKVYATDADEEALAQARQACFEQRQVEPVPTALRDKYFERAKDGRFLFHPDLRRSLIFGRHDLVQDASISRIDLLICRNTLMYFNVEAQARILARFHFALNRDGYLFLGKAETLLSHAGSFRPMDLKRRVFQHTASGKVRDRLLALTSAPEPTHLPEGTREVRLREAAFLHGPVAQVVIDHRGFLQLANEAARRMFWLSPADLGRPLKDLELSCRPVDLRPHIDQVYREGSPVRISEVPWQGPQGEIYLDVQIIPLADDKGGMLGAGISFHDLSYARQLRTDLQNVHQELETAYEELQSANEELETTNEELQATVEELETTNEELQSANEELETMNEELQSTNEELRTLNDQLQQRGTELDELNGLFSSILGALGGGVVVLDHSLAIKVWSPRAEDLWGLRSDEVLGTSFLRLDIGIPVDRLMKPLRDSLDGDGGERSIELDGVNRRGKPILCRVTVTPLPGNQADGNVLLLMEEARRGEEHGEAGDGAQAG